MALGYDDTFTTQEAVDSSQEFATVVHAGEYTMNLDELRSVQSTERQTDSLQNLRPSFYQEVGEYIAELEAERDRVAAAADDPFASPEVRQLTDEIETARDVVEAIYERRMGKLVKQASLSAAGMSADDGGLTAEEQDLFVDLVDRIQSNKHRVLETLEGTEAESDGQSAGESIPTADDPTAPEPDRSDPTALADRDRSTADPRSETPPEPPAELAEGASAHEPTTNDDHEPATDEPGGLSPADVMGGVSPSDDDSSRSAASEESPPPPPDTPDSDTPAPDTDRKTPPIPDEDHPPEPSETPPELSETPAEGDRSSAQSEPSADRDQPATDEPAAADDEPAVDRLTVKITQNVGSILGVDDREYTLVAEDIVTLPEQNATPLVEQDAAEPIDTE